MKKYALIGRSLSHSYSRSFFQDYFSKNGIDAIYDNLDLKRIEEFDHFRKKYDGFNVTIPYKEDIMPFLDELDPVAKEIGAVNTIRREGHKLIGYNTDAFGFHQSIKPFLTNKHERALILGTGGASKAVAYVLKNLGIEVFWVSREPKGDREYPWNEVNEQMIRSCKLIVNCTPIGMYPDVDQKPELPYNCFSEEHLAVDLIYNPSKTLFLEEAQKYGATVINGESMLKEQALKSYAIWTSNHV